MSYRYFGPRDHKPTIREVLWVDGKRPTEIAIDAETVSLKNRTPIGVSIAASDRESLYFPLWPEEDNPDMPWELVQDHTIDKVYHNASFDLDVLKDYEPSAVNIKATLNMAHLLGLPGEMESLIWFAASQWQHAPLVQSAKVLMTEHGASTMLDLDQDLVARKCCIDTITTMHMYWSLREQVDWDYFLSEMELFPIFIKMGRRGIAIDQDSRQAFEEELEDEMVYYRQLAEAEGFNPGSPQQVGYILAKRGNYLPFTRGYKSLSTDKKVLEKCSDPIAALVLQYRRYQKLLGTYVRPLRDQERAYTRFHLDAMTGRPSSTERNMQNVPPLIRPMFLPDNEVFTDFDFSQLELRILAYLSGDQEMRYVFESGLNIHEQTADAMGCAYKTAKNTGFAMIYGGTEETVMETARTSDIGLARRFIRAWASKYREAWDWIQYQQESGLNGGRVQTIGGRVFVLPIGEESDGAIRRKSVNYPIQGSAAEVFKKALRTCQHLERALQVHDELIIDGAVKLPEGLDSLVPGLHTPASLKRMVRWE